MGLRCRLLLIMLCIGLLMVCMPPYQHVQSQGPTATATPIPTRNGNLTAADAPPIARRIIRHESRRAGNGTRRVEKLALSLI